MRESWTDARLDGFAVQVDRRFDEVDRRFDEVDRRFDEVDRRFDGVDKRFDILERRVDNGFNRVDADLRALREETKTEFIAVRGEMNSRFEQVEGRIDDLQRTLLQLGGGAIATLVAGFLGVIVTQL